MNWDRITGNVERTKSEQANAILSSQARIRERQEADERKAAIKQAQISAVASTCLEFAQWATRVGYPTSEISSDFSLWSEGYADEFNKCSNRWSKKDAKKRAEQKITELKNESKVSYIIDTQLEYEYSAFEKIERPVGFLVASTKTRSHLIQVCTRPSSHPEDDGDSEPIIPYTMTESVGVSLDGRSMFFSSIGSLDPIRKPYEAFPTLIERVIEHAVTEYYVNNNLIPNAG